MTELLKDLMHERADSLGAPDLDVLAMVRDGNRRATRRRTAIVGLTAAAAVAAVFGGSTLLTGERDSGTGRDLVADGTDASPHALSWAIGSTIRTASEQTDVGMPIRSYVETDAGYVFVTTDMSVYVWRDGRAVRLGALGAATADERELLADGSRVAWVDADNGYTVHDLADDRVWTYPGHGKTSHGAQVTALDGNVAWIKDRQSAVSWDYRDGAITLLRTTNSASVIDSEQGVLLLNGGGTQDDAIVMGDSRVPVAVDQWGNLSPDGQLASVEHNDEGFIVDAATGEQQPFNHGHEWAIAFDWINDTHIATLVFEGVEDHDTMVGSLLDCDTVTATCETVLDELPALGSFQLPIGVHFEDE